jgi:hypothetical protein
LQASSNGLKGTRDISNRMCIVRIRKRSDDYEFLKFNEGDMLDHVRANQGKFLGAVHAIIEEWVKNGKPKTNEGRHDFRKWAGSLDWIMVNVFKRRGMLDGHRDIQNRVSTPILGTLRELAIEAERSERLDEEMNATELIVFAEESGVEINGIKGKDDDQKARWIGGQLSQAFKTNGSEALEIDRYRFKRVMTREQRTDGQGYFESKHYLFELN